MVTTEERLRAIVRAEFEAVRAEHSTPRSDEPLLLTCSKLCKKLGV